MVFDTFLRYLKIMQEDGREFQAAEVGIKISR